MNEKQLIENIMKRTKCNSIQAGLVAKESILFYIQTAGIKDARQDIFNIITETSYNMD